jgi:hypothetical protein
MSALPLNTGVKRHIQVSIWLSVYEYTPQYTTPSYTTLGAAAAARPISRTRFFGLLPTTQNRLRRRKMKAMDRKSACQGVKVTSADPVLHNGFAINDG